MPYDLLLINALIVDGSGAPSYNANVAVEGDTIAAITQEVPESARTIDLGGKVLSPGFIDMHSHSEFILLRDDHLPLMAPFLRQGITTLIGGNCGFAPAPVLDAVVPMCSHYTRFLSGAELDWSWRTFAEFLDTLETRGTALNIGCLAAHGISRMAVMGFEGRPAHEDEISQMQRLVSDALEQGALGLSAGLMYAPGMFSTTQELIDTAQPLRGTGKPFTFHLRGLSETFLHSLSEAVSIGAAQDIPVQISHFCVGGSGNWPLSEQGLESLEKNRKRGVDVGLDMFPYSWANTTINAVFPRWALAGGPPALVERLAAPITRDRIERDIENVVPQWPHWEGDSWSDNIVRNNGGWDGIILTVFSDHPRPEFVGKSVTEIAAMENKRPFDALADLVIEQNAQILMLCGSWSGNDESDDPLWDILLHPLTAIETDAIVLDEHYPHPATYGTFPAFLHRALRVKESRALERAVYKCTGLPAERMNLKNRGVIRPGAKADLVAFDPQTVNCLADAKNPRQNPTGIEWVILNGEIVVEGGELVTKGLRGQVIRG